MINACLTRSFKSILYIYMWWILMIVLISWLGWKKFHRSTQKGGGEMRGGGEILSNIFSALLDHPPILSQVSTFRKPHHSIPKIHLYVGQPYQTSHHFGLILEHYHPLFTLITQEAPLENPSPSGGPVMAIVLEHQLPPKWEQVIKLYNAELLLVSTRKSYLDSIQDL